MKIAVLILVLLAGCSTKEQPHPISGWFEGVMTLNNDKMHEHDDGMNRTFCIGGGGFYDGNTDRCETDQMMSNF